jgi:uncharacterized protein (TIGR02145 family)
LPWGSNAKTLIPAIFADFAGRETISALTQVLLANKLSSVTNKHKMNIKNIIWALLFLAGVARAQGPCPGQTGASISGKVSYDNTQNTPMSCIKVFLNNSIGVVIDSTVTDNTGTYTFCGISTGNYSLLAKTDKAPGGINSIDALSAAKHFVGLINLQGMRFSAADVKKTNYINSTDAYLINKRFTQLIPSFLSDDWLFENPDIEITNPVSYVINIIGICAGDVNASFLPPDCDNWTCGDTMTDNRDGQKYATVQIGTQCWMQKNMNIGTLVDSLTWHSDNDTLEKYCYHNDPAYCNVYGGLYFWEEAMQYNITPGSQGICPTNYHIPTNNEWQVLSTFLGGELVAGGKMKEAGFTHWSSPNTNATNESGFTALPAGDLIGNPPAYFSSLSFGTTFWSSS